MKTTKWLAMSLLVSIAIGCESSKDEDLSITNSIFKEKSMDCIDELLIDMPSLCHEIDVKHNFSGLMNFREFTPSADSNIVLRQGQLFRSDAFHKINEDDQTVLTQLGIKTIIDLRSESEINEMPNKLIPSLVNSFNTPIGSDPAQLKSLGITEETVSEIRTYFLNGEFNKIDKILQDYGIDLESIRENRYKDFATKYNASVSKCLKLLVDPNNYPIAFHCQGGKDRTGYLAVVIQKILGFSDLDVIRDYLTTNLYTYESLEKQFLHGPKSLRPSYGAHKSQILEAIRQIDQTYGSFDNYLEEVLLISKEDQQAIKHNLLIMPIDMNSSRFVSFEGASNFRDIGGLKTKDGKKVKEKHVYRSAKLTRLTKNDFSKMEDLGITKIIDLRSDSELELEPENMPQPFTYLHRRIGKEDLDVKDFEKKFLSGYWNGERFTEYMLKGNKVMMEQGDFHFPQILKDIANNPGATVFHCAGGKDRTGVVTALLLEILNVPRASIINDYLTTNIQQKEHYKKKEQKLSKYTKDALDPKLYEAQKAQRAYIIKALNTIDEYGGVEKYVLNHLKMDPIIIQKLKNKLTY